MVEISFESWDLLFQQIMVFFVIPVLIFALMRFLFQTHITKAFKQDEPMKYIYVPRTSSDVELKEPVITAKDMTYEIEKAIYERVDMKIKCPYCNQNNVSSALMCQHCGGQL